MKRKARFLSVLIIMTALPSVALANAVCVYLFGSTTACCWGYPCPGTDMACVGYNNCYGDDDCQFCSLIFTEEGCYLECF